MKRTSETAPPLPCPDVPREAIQTQLDRIIGSKRFADSGRLKSLLAFVVNQYLEGNQASLKETVIGTDLFKKPAGYDPQNASIVRTTAQRLRAELAAYYELEGADDEVIITLPKGHYRPQFIARAASERGIKDSTIAELEPPNPKWLPRHWVFALLVIGGLGLIVAVLIPTHRSDIETASAAPRIGRLFARSTSEGNTPARFNVGYDIGGLLVAPDGKTLYAIEWSGRTVTAMGVNDHRIKRKFQLPHAARGAVISGDGKHIYVSSPDNLVMIIDADRGKVDRLIPTGGPIFDLAVTSDEKKIFLAMGSDGLKRIQMPSGEVTALSALACPLFLTMDGGNKRLFVTYQCHGPGGREGHDVVETYDPVSERRLGVIGDLPMVGERPSISPDGNLIVLDGFDACITEKYDHDGCASVPSHVYHLVRTSDRSVLKSFARPKETLGVSFSPDGSRLIFGGDRLVVMDWARDEVTEVVPMSQRGYSRFTFAPDGAHVFVNSYLGQEEFLIFDGDGQRCRPPTIGAVNQYSGDGTFDDSVGVSSLSAVGTVTFAPGLIGQAFQFKGEGSTLQGGGGAGCWLCEGNWTESFFTKFNSIDGEMTLLEREGSSDFWRHRIFKANNNHIVLQAGDPPNRFFISGSAPVKPDIWYHVALVADSTRRSLYIDGVLQGQLDFPRPNKYSTDRGVVIIGANQSKRAALNGLVDEIIWHARPLDAAEVMALSQSRSHGTCRP